MGESKRRNKPGQAPANRKRRPAMGIAVAVLLVLAVIAATIWLTRPGSGPDVAELPVAPEGAEPFPAAVDQVGVSLGEADAPVVVREFADYQCPACATFASVADRIKEEYVESGQVRFVYFDFPLEDIHDNAMLAAQAARCAGDQNAYWAMHDRLFAQQSEWSGHGEAQDVFVRYAEELGLNPQRLERCLETELHREAVEESQALAQRFQVRATPTVLVDNIVMSGAQTWPRMKAVIERELENQ